jgi:hypothetical protein
MASSVCTLFEGHYHYGVAGLTNSLYHHGYRGVVYAGYRGQLPVWASTASENVSISWPGCKTLNVNTELSIHFLPIDTQFHLAHYKPEFMLALINGIAANDAGIVYFDPDIVIKCRWAFFEQWMVHGVAMVHEVVSNDMPPTHPSRKQWEAVIALYNKTVIRQLSSYINCGFCGVAKKHIEFLQVWKDVIHLAVNNFNQNPATFASFDRTSMFWSIDQDAFNIAAMCCNTPLSEMGPEAMDFVAAGWTMSHATGSPKPWKKMFFIEAFKGNPPTKPERIFWQHASGIIKVFNSSYVKYKLLCIAITSFTGRFYRRY